jgi:hypothetical protein
MLHDRYALPRAAAFDGTLGPQEFRHRHSAIFSFLDIPGRFWYEKMLCSIIHYE